MLRTTLTLLALTSLAGCFRSYGIDDAGDDPPPILWDRDAGPSRADDSGPVRVDPPPPSSCGAPDGLPDAPECVGLCQETCERFASCGGDGDECLEGCYEAYRCPGETPGHDAAICRSASPAIGCDSVCEWVSTFGGFATTGPSCPLTGPATPTPCASRDYCDCSGECVPLIDNTTGCVCPCDDPFNCSGDLCDCGCGGATYLGCAAVGQCMANEVGCDLATERGALGADGCPICAPR